MIFSPNPAIYDLCEPFADALLDLAYRDFGYFEGFCKLGVGLTLQEPVEDREAARVVRRSQLRDGGAVMGIHPLLLPKFRMIDGRIGRRWAIRGGAEPGLPGDDSFDGVAGSRRQVGSKATFVAIVAKFGQPLGEAQEHHLSGIFGVGELQSAGHAIAKQEFAIPTVELMPGTVIAFIPQTQQERASRGGVDSRGHGGGFA